MKSPKQNDDTMLTQRRSIITFITVICLLAVSLVMAGCQSQQPTPVIPVTQPTQDNANGAQQPASPAVNDTQKKVDIATDNTNKSSVQVQQEVIANAVADGMYADNVSYFSPGGKNTVEFDITVQNDVITAVSAHATSNVDGTSARHISSFASAIPALVVGQKIDALNLPHQVGGSSLTTAAFKQEISNLIAKY